MRDVLRVQNEPDGSHDYIVTHYDGSFATMISGMPGAWSAYQHYEQDVDWPRMVDTLTEEYGLDMYVESVNAVLRRANTTYLDDMIPKPSDYQPIPLLPDMDEPEANGIYVISVQRLQPAGSYSEYAIERTFNGDDDEWAAVGSSKAYTWDDIKSIWCNDRHRVMIRLIVTEDGDDLSHD